MMTAPILEVVEAAPNSHIGVSPTRMPRVIEQQLTESHAEFLRFLIRRLGDRDTAEDVLQQFYLRVVSRGYELKNTESMVAWLYTVLRTTLIDHYRKEASRRGRDADYALMQSISEDRWDAEPEDRVCGCLSAILPTLKPEYSQVLQRVDLGETPPRRVAAALGITAANLRVRLHRARQALKQALLARCGQCAENGCQDCSCSHSAAQHNTGKSYRSIAA